MRMKFHLQSASYGRGVELRLCSLNAAGDIDGEAQPAIFHSIKEGEMWNAPMATITKDAAQNLIDELWALGYRPERGQMSIGQVAATEKHLNDMRTIVFSRMKIAKP